MKNVVLKIKTINKIENSSNRYDIEVKNNKNFFADNILVHNTKLSLVRNSEPYNTDYRKNWIVSYKNNIIYSTEFDGIENGEGSIGTSQYKIVHDHLKKVHPNTKGISENTEFFIEYLMAKPTLTRDYTTKNGMVLLAYSPTSIQVQHGMIKTQPEGFHTEDREQYAQMLGMKVPKVVYTGVLKDISPSKGTPTEVLADIKRRLLNVESEFGGKTEGVVIEMPDGTTVNEYSGDNPTPLELKAVEGKEGLYERPFLLCAEGDDGKVQQAVGRKLKVKAKSASN